MDASIPFCGSLASPTDSLRESHSTTPDVVRTLVQGASRRALALRAGAILVLLAGYADLVRGGLTAAPLLLVLGYVVLVPLVFLLD